MTLPASSLMLRAVHTKSGYHKEIGMYVILSEGELCKKQKVMLPASGGDAGGVRSCLRPDYQNQFPPNFF
jgi:hypothetical protein